MTTEARPNMKKFIFTTVTTASIFFNMQVFAQESHTTFGSVDCGSWIKEPTTAKKLWLLGYLTGLNAMRSGLIEKASDPLDGLGSANQAYLWMDNYCQKNPLKRVSNGGWELFMELTRAVK